MGSQPPGCSGILKRRAILQTGVSVKRHLSRIFPVFPSVTRVGASPAPGSTARLCFFGIQKIFSPGPRKERGKKRFYEPSE